ncbi:DUF4437 domain-containing protein [Streptomyces sp. AK02-01A]|uniref:DUF4437 domain-containing protein n=1 Tax=Streptomyces sp. AK02-01A TaxID=3028648 RepID=UPI0029B2D2CF|nr:DUF4437 domain-containing protein [Streptomyces sp. AK02-01A]MDX3854889.1 DUF4437 domain-containing protein [Streptomyces sp. AK02-01A]
MIDEQGGTRLPKRALKSRIPSVHQLDVNINSTVEVDMTTECGVIVTCPEDLTWEAVGPLDGSGRGIFISRLFGNPGEAEPTSFLMKYSGGIEAPPHIHSSDYYAVVVSGKFRHFLERESECKALTAGATWFQKGRVRHQDVCIGPEDGILSIFWPQGFDVEVSGAITLSASCSILRASVTHP